MVCPWNLSTGETETGGSVRLISQPAYWMGEFPVQWDTLTQKIEWRVTEEEGNIDLWPPPVHVYTGTHRWIHTNKKRRKREIIVYSSYVLLRNECDALTHHSRKMNSEPGVGRWLSVNMMHSQSPPCLSCSPKPGSQSPCCLGDRDDTMYSLPGPSHLCSEHVPSSPQLNPGE